MSRKHSHATAQSSRNRHTGFSRSLASAVSLMFFLLAAAAFSSAQTFTSLFTFNQANGAAPLGVLVQGLDGDLYGSTSAGGANNEGSVFKITPAGTITTLYSFCSQASCTDGSTPYAGLVLATNGIFYGTTSAGGTNGFGTIFQITSAGQLTTLYSFTGSDGEYPHAGLVQATNGNLYGTTAYGGAGTSNGGTFFEITTAGKFTLLYSFAGAPDGSQPYGTLVQASNGDLYGTTYGGGANSYGAIFQITTAGNEKVLHSFAISDGKYPNAGLIQATSGTLYGTTAAGGATTNNIGTVFKITTAGTFTSLYSFCTTTSCPDGSDPQAGLIQANDGNLYGVTWTGGTNNDGTIFEMNTTGQLTTLHSFASTDGLNPGGTLLQATNGILYGTTYQGGGGWGTVFSLSNGLAAFVESLQGSGKVGAKVTILGMNLSGTSAVSFNGTAATFTASGSRITATVPTGATTGPITVITRSATLTSKTTFLVTPQLKSFTPPSGPVGTSVTITGVSLTQTSKVTFNGKAASFTVNSDTQVTATVPSGATTGKIKITTPGGTPTSTTNFTVN